MRYIALILTVLAAGAADAHAATVTTSERHDSDGRVVTAIQYDAAPGETNRLAAIREGAVWRIRDPGATIVPGGVCRAVDEHVLVCEPATRDSEVHVALGDGDDELLGLGDVRADGGEGEDRLVASEAEGGDGDDVLLGDGGRNEFRGGSGDDRIDGRGGRDVLFGEEDDDRLNGGAGGDKLFGEGGEDVLSGGLGHDMLNPGYDRDRTDGGPGRDRLWSAKDFAPDRVRCDPSDRVTADRDDRLAGRCGTIARLPVRALRVDAEVLGDEMFAIVGTPTTMSLSGYAGRLRLQVRIGRRWIGLGIHRITAITDSTGWFWVPARAASTLAHGSHPLRGMMVLDPGLRAGMFPIPLGGRTFVR